MDAAAQSGAPWPAAVAVSGGGDSLALMVLLAGWARSRQMPAPIVLTVDHGLRRDSGRDSRHVTKLARQAGLKAHVLRWTGKKPESDIEAAAREARYRLMGRWCSKNGMPALYLAHTLEDQAETFLLRLARGSGIDGLSAMKVVAPLPVLGSDGVVVVRPLLGMRRQHLRDYLAGKGLAWVEDSMNTDPRFARVRVRNAWPMLERLGLSPARIAAAASHLGRAREALEREELALLREASRPEKQGIALDPTRLAAAPPEIGMRALATVLMQVSKTAYRPRFERLERLYIAVCEGQVTSGRTLNGCRIAPLKTKTAPFGPQTLLIVPERAREERVERAQRNAVGKLQGN